MAALNKNVQSANSNFIKVLKKRQEITPDFAAFRQRTDPVVFIYDTYRYGTQHQRNILGEAEWLGTGLTIAHNYYMRMGSLYAPTGPRTHGASVYQERVWAWPETSKSFQDGMGAIRGDLFRVSPAHIVVLDKIYGRGDYSERKEVSVIFEQQKDAAIGGRCLTNYFGHPLGLAFMYHFNDDEMEEITYTNKYIPLAHPDVPSEYQGKQLLPQYRPYLEFTNYQISAAHVPIVYREPSQTEEEQAMDVWGRNYYQGNFCDFMDH